MHLIRSANALLMSPGERPSNPGLRACCSPSLPSLTDRFGQRGVLLGVSFVREDYVNRDCLRLRRSEQAQPGSQRAPDASDAAEFHQRRFIDCQQNRFRRPRWWLVPSEHQVVGRIVDGRPEQPASGNRQHERRRQQPHIRRRTFPTLPAHTGLPIAFDRTTASMVVSPASLRP